MAYEKQGAQTLDYRPCRYGASKLLFRGPKRRLEGRYAAFLGGTETYGKFIAQPFAALVEAQTGMPCVNMGWPNAGLDVMVNEAEIVATASRAAVTIVQVPGAQSLTNRYYSVHPRRNDRFVQASPLLRGLYGEVDFTSFHFVRHMLGCLAEVSPDRFVLLRDEVQTAWIARMARLLGRIEAPVLLLWVSAHPPETRADAPEIAQEPALVTCAMLSAVRGQAAGLIDATLSPAARAGGTTGMVYSEFETNVAAELPGPTAHAEIAQRLVPLIAQYAQA